MKKLVYALLLILAIGACDPIQQEEPVSVVGQWKLVNVETKSATIGSETVDVYLDFTESGQFTMYQIIGKGRPRMFTGSYTFIDNQLSGIYSDASQWASTYTVAKSGENSITLTTASGNETDTYQSTSIPQSVIEQAY